MIKINNIISIFDEKLKFKAIKSTGPGGQHVNKVSTGIILQYNILNHNYPGWFIDNLKNKINSKKLSKNGIITIKATNYRSQSRNKKDAIDRLLILFKECSNKKKIRKKTRPPASSNEKRINDKKKLSKKKNLRKPPAID